MSNGHIRPGTAADRPQLRAIQDAALSEPWPGLLEPESPIEPRLWVCETDPADVVGYAAAVTAGKPVAYLPELAVEPARQGEGYGSALLEAVRADLTDDGFERVRLTAPAGEERLRRFYERHGFEAGQRVAERFGARDGVVFERPLQGQGGDGQR